MQKKPNDGHRQRLKERFLKSGLDDFAPHNILEFILFYTNARGDTNKTAHYLMEKFGTLAEVFNAPREELVKIEGVGEHTAVLLRAMPDICRNYMLSQIPDKEVLNSTTKIGEYLVNYFIGRTDEVVYALCLDSSFNVIKCELLCRGSVNSSSLNIRKLVEVVLLCNACAVVIAHNHPRGIAVASNKDILTSNTLKKGLKQLDIELLDHIIVAQNTFVSLKECNYLE